MGKVQFKGLAKSEGITRAPYAAGKYEFKDVELEETTTKKGDYMLVAKMVIGDLFPEQPGKRDVKGKRYTHRFVVIEGHDSYDFMIAKMKDFFNAVGIRVAADNSFTVPKKAIAGLIYGDMIQSPDSRDGTMQAQVQKWYSEKAFEELGAASAKSPKSSDDDED